MMLIFKLILTLDQMSFMINNDLIKGLRLTANAGLKLNCNSKIKIF